MPIRHIAIFLLSAAIIAFQLALMQVLSIIQWHHLAFMVISMALLGFGAAGTFLSLYRQKLLNAYGRLFPALLFITAIGLAWAVPASQLQLFRFDIFLLFSDLSHIWKLVATYLLFFLPFFSGALAIGLTFVLHVGQIGKLYFSNLIGSGAGGLLALALMSRLSPVEMPGLIAILPFLAGLLTLKRKRPERVHARSDAQPSKTDEKARSMHAKGQQPVLYLLALASALLLALAIFHPAPLRPSQYKDMSMTLLLPEAKIELEKNSPYGLLQVVSSPALRHAPGLSLNYTEPVPVRKAIFLNGDWAGTVAHHPVPGAAVELNHSTAALPWVLRQHQKVLVTSAGTGESIAHAIANGATHITAIEPNTELTSLLCNELASDNTGLFNNPIVHVHSTEARTWLFSDTAFYDLILLPDVSSFGGNSGVQAMSEQYEMTKEAFAAMLQKLKPGGVIAVSCWLDYPLRYPLKLLATFVEALEQSGVANPVGHIAVIRSWGNMTFAVKNEPFTEAEADSIRSFCYEMSFDPALLPGIQQSERQQFNQLQDSRLLDYFDILLSPSRDSLYRNYAFNIKPATDQRPFFSQFLRWKALPGLARDMGAGSVPFLELGYLLVVVTLMQIALIAAVLIVLPLFRLKENTTAATGHEKHTGSGWIILYFGGIGMGFMFVEIVLIQQFTLFFGSPVYAAAAVISGLLIFSGAGSYYSPRINIHGNKLVLAILIIAALLLLYASLLTPLLQKAATLPLALKALVLTASLFPVGFLMGIPFPSGLTRVHKRHAPATPWAWAINGYFSVVSTALATIIAVELGFSWVMALAAMAYAVAAASVFDFGKEGRDVANQGLDR